jgi:ribosomal protein S4E
MGELCRSRSTKTASKHELTKKLIEVRINRNSDKLTMVSFGAHHGTFGKLMSILEKTSKSLSDDSINYAFRGKNSVMS